MLVPFTHRNYHSAASNCRCTGVCPGHQHWFCVSEWWRTAFPGFETRSCRPVPPHLYLTKTRHAGSGSDSFSISIRSALPGQAPVTGERRTSFFLRSSSAFQMSLPLSSGKLIPDFHPTPPCHTFQLVSSPAAAPAVACGPGCNTAGKIWSGHLSLKGVKSPRKKCGGSEMKIRCRKCGQVIAVGVYWDHVECPQCGTPHDRLDCLALRSWEWAGEPEYWLCWSCEEEFEVRQPLAPVAYCFHCGARNARQDSFIQPVEVQP
jgi:Zn finger protein HypA/HybF involved in hydrogenase expression